MLALLLLSCTISLFKLIFYLVFDCGGFVMPFSYVCGFLFEIFCFFFLSIFFFWNACIFPFTFLLHKKEVKMVKKNFAYVVFLFSIFQYFPLKINFFFSSYSIYFLGIRHVCEFYLKQAIPGVLFLLFVPLLWNDSVLLRLSMCAFWIRDGKISKLMLE